MTSTAYAHSVAATQCAYDVRGTRPPMLSLWYTGLILSCAHARAPRACQSTRSTRADVVGAVTGGAGMMPVCPLHSFRGVRVKYEIQCISLSLGARRRSVRVCAQWSRTRVLRYTSTAEGASLHSGLRSIQPLGEARQRGQRPLASSPRACTDLPYMAYNQPLGGDTAFQPHGGPDLRLHPHDTLTSRTPPWTTCQRAA